MTASAAQKAGLPPGTIVFVGRQRVEKIAVSLIEYDAEHIAERGLDVSENWREWATRPAVAWINVTGVHDTELLRRIGDGFHIHHLVMEDIAHTVQRPKLEDYGDYLYLVMRMMYRDPKSENILAEQISFVVGATYLLTFQEIEGDVFDVIRDRLRTAKGRVRSQGPDYLAYALMDAIVDNYFVVMEEMNDRIETLQSRVVVGNGLDLLERIHRLKREIVFMRKNVWPLREVFSGMTKSESPLVTGGTRVYLRDLYEHAVQTIDAVETMRDTLSGALDIYVSSQGNRMNETMRVLTVIATIFMPLTFMAGIYGMNFELMPELRWRYGYAGAWAVMLTVGLGMTLYFKRRKWL